MSTIVEGELTSVAMCWCIERPDGAGIALTSHDRAVSNEGFSYSPEPGIVPASVSQSLGLEPHSAEVAGALTSDRLDLPDLALGRWDGARVRLSAMDWRDEDATPIQLLAGEIGSMSMDGVSFSAELCGAAAKLERPVCPATSAECRAEFGDKHCRVDLAGRTVVAQVASAIGGLLTLGGTFGDEFVLGRLRYLSGANCGISTVILSVDGATIMVRDLPRAQIETGCKVELREGCDKRFQTCVEHFSNAVNFRGEPTFPGTTS